MLRQFEALRGDPESQAKMISTTKLDFCCKKCRTAVAVHKYFERIAVVDGKLKQYALVFARIDEATVRRVKSRLVPFALYCGTCDQRLGFITETPEKFQLHLDCVAPIH